MARTRAFVSYCTKDRVWCERLLSHFSVLESEGQLSVWDDFQINARDEWYPAIQSAMQEAQVAILLVSADFFASEFIRNEEIPMLLMKHSADGMLILPLIARPCAWELLPWLSGFQVRPVNGIPLSGC
jgi:hypothetical protein